MRQSSKPTMEPAPLQVEITSGEPDRPLTKVERNFLKALLSDPGVSVGMQHIEAVYSLRKLLGCAAPEG